jgi:hypothetical protein
VHIYTINLIITFIFKIITLNELLSSFFQQIKRQFGIASRITGAAAGASVQVEAAAALLNVARHIRDELPVQNRENFLELEACLADGDDETMTSSRVQLKDFIARGAFGTVKRENVYSTCLRVFIKRFASQSMSYSPHRCPINPII